MDKTHTFNANNGLGTLTRGFKRVSLQQGESKVITFNLDKFDFAFYDSEMNYIVEAGEFDILVGNSSRKKDLKKVSYYFEETIQINTK